MGNSGGLITNPIPNPTPTPNPATTGGLTITPIPNPTPISPASGGMPVPTVPNSFIPTSTPSALGGKALDLLGYGNALQQAQQAQQMIGQALGYANAGINAANQTTGELNSVASFVHNTAQNSLNTLNTDVLPLLPQIQQSGSSASQGILEAYQGAVQQAQLQGQQQLAQLNAILGAAGIAESSPALAQQQTLQQQTDATVAQLQGQGQAQSAQALQQALALTGQLGMQEASTANQIGVSSGQQQAYDYATGGQLELNANALGAQVAMQGAGVDANLGGMLGSIGINAGNSIARIGAQQQQLGLEGLGLQGQLLQQAIGDSVLANNIAQGYNNANAQQLNGLISGILGAYGGGASIGMGTANAAAASQAAAAQGKGGLWGGIGTLGGMLGGAMILHGGL